MTTAPAPAGAVGAVSPGAPEEGSPAVVGGVGVRWLAVELARSAPRSTAPRVKIEGLVRGSLMVV
jgi:hypothetical protein